MRGFKRLLPVSFAGLSSSGFVCSRLFCASAEHRPVIVLGSGPAGLTAALYAARANLSPLVLEGEQSGGQLTTTTEVENYPGFEHGVDGNELIDAMKAQSQRFGADFRYETVSSVDFSDSNLRLTTGKQEYSCDACIIATGASAMYLGLDSEQRLIGAGVSACATCDGYFYRDKHVAVVGGGDTAMEEALFLTRFASKVTVIHRRDELRASKIMAERASANPKIEFMWDSVVTEVLGGDQLTGIEVKNVKTGALQQLDFIEGLFLGIGHRPNTEFLKTSGVPLNADGYIDVVKEQTPVSTGIDGVYACGDCADHRYRQAVTAAGTGCIAAIEAERYIASMPNGKDYYS